MNVFRSSEGAPPVVSCLGGVLFALDAETGQKLWSRPLDKPVGRLLLTWRHLFVTSLGPMIGDNSVVRWFDVHTGEPKGAFEVDFEVTAALARGTHIYLAGAQQAAGFTADGNLLFRVKVELRGQKKTFGSDEHDVVGRDGSGRELWRTPIAHKHAGTAALLVGDSVAQPDLDR